MVPAAVTAQTWQQQEPEAQLSTSSPEHTEHPAPVTAFNLCRHPGSHSCAKEGTRPSPESRTVLTCQALCRWCWLRGHTKSLQSSCTTPARSP